MFYTQKLFKYLHTFKILISGMYGNVIPKI